MRYVLLTLVLAAAAWFGYGFLAGDKEARASGKDVPVAGEVVSQVPLEPGSGGSPPAGEPKGGEATPAAPRPKGGKAAGPSRTADAGLGRLERTLSRGDTKEAARIVKAEAPRLASSREFRALAEKAARKAFRAGELERAARILTDLVDSWTRGPLGKDDLAELEGVRRLLNRVMDELLFNPGGAWRSRTYKVKRGDALERIARHFGRAEGNRITAGFLEAVNRTPAQRLRAGQNLRIPLGKFHVVVEKKSFILKLFLDDILVRFYRVGLGKDGKTPSARFTVLLKQKNPVWWHPTKGPIPHGHPDNPLGDYFIKLKSDRYTGFGIHGTRESERDSIGKEESQGCVRMLPEDVKELFSFLPKGAEVLIR